MMSGVTVLRVQPARTLRGIVGAPAAPGTVVAATLVASFAKGRSTIRLPPGSVEPATWLGALRAVGVGVTSHRGAIEIEGTGGRYSQALGGVRCPSDDVGAAALLALLAGQPFRSTVLEGGATPRGPRGRRALADIARVLRRRGAELEGVLEPSRPLELRLPIEVRGRPLSELEFEVGVGALHEKVAALASGLAAHVPTFLREPLVSDDRFERALTASGLAAEAVGGMLHLSPPQGDWAPIDVLLPADLGHASWLLAAGLGCTVENAPDSAPGSPRVVGVRGVGVSATQAGLVEALRDAGAALEAQPTGDVLGQLVCDLRVAPTRLAPLQLGGERALRASGALMPLAVLAARASGQSVLADVGGVEPGGLDDAAALLAAFGAEAQVRDGGLVVDGSGGGRSRAAYFDPRGSAALAMGAVVLALGADGVSSIGGAECIADVFPRFVAALRGLGAEIEVSD